MKLYDQKEKHVSFFGMSWFPILLIVFLISTVTGLMALSKSWAAPTIMEVYQQKDGKVFGLETSLDVFNNPKLGGQKLVAPFTKGSYDFVVHNSSDDYLLPYSLDIVADNPENIPLVFNLKKNGEYIFGGEGLSNMRPLTRVYEPEAFLQSKRNDLYTISWEWKTQSDEIDTAIGNKGTQLYNLTIIAKGTIGEVDTNVTYPSKPSPTVTISPSQPVESAVPSQPLEPSASDNFGGGGGEPPGSNVEQGPKTEDVSNMAFWLTIFTASMILLCIILFVKRRGEEDENSKNRP